MGGNRGRNPEKNRGRYDGVRRHTTENSLQYSGVWSSITLEVAYSCLLSHVSTILSTDNQTRDTIDHHTSYAAAIDNKRPASGLVM